MQKPIFAEMSYVDKEGNELKVNNETVVRIEGNAVDDLICIDFNPSLRNGDAMVLRFEPHVLMQALTDALIAFPEPKK